MTTESEKLKPADSQVQPVDQSKRSLTKAGITLPVIMTLAGRPAFGGQTPCISQRMSGNMSHHDEGSCVTGLSPEQWKDKFIFVEPANGDVNTETTLDICANVLGQNQKVRIRREVTSFPLRNYVWSYDGSNSLGISYGSLALIRERTYINIEVGQNEAISQEVTISSLTSCTGNHTPVGSLSVGQIIKPGTIMKYQGSNCTTDGVYSESTSLDPIITPTCCDYTGGVTFVTLFGYGPDTPIREILCDVNNDLASCVAAMLNALAISDYVMTPDQVKAICSSGVSPVPGSSLDEFLQSTW